MLSPRPDSSLTPVLLFDAGNTIIELDYERLAGICTDHGSAVAADAMKDAVTRVRPDLDRFIRRPSASTESTDSRVFLLGLVLDRLSIPPSRRAAITADILPVLQILWGCAVPDADRVLSELAARGHRLGVVSNSDGTVDQRIEEAGLAHHFEVIIDSGAVGVEKPDPGIFGIALSAMGASPEDATYIGDLPAVDVLGAERAGLTPVLIDPLDLFPAVACRRIRSLEDLLADRKPYDGGIGADRQVNECS